MKPLEITAHLVAGYSSKDPWSPSLDGALAYVEMRRRLGDDFAASSAIPSSLRPVEGLPLEVCRWGDQWWYAASSPIIVGLHGRDRRFFHRRFDDRHERYLPSGVKKVMTAAGPYKTTRLFDVHVICRALRWHVIGERTRIEDMLTEIDQIGGRRGVGYGRVERWQIEDGNARIARGHRPLPADLQEVQGSQVMPWGLVPPGRATIAECVMPEERHEEA